MSTAYDSKEKGIVMPAEHIEQAPAVHLVPEDDVAKVKGTFVEDTDARGYVAPGLVVSEEDSKRLRRKIHTRILPLMCLAYITQALDKGTLGPASIMGWQTDVGAVGNDYALSGTFLWCGIIAGEPFLLVGLTFSLHISAVFAVRFVLGFFEAVFGPTLLSITVQWYLKAEQPFVSAVWQSMLGVSTAITAILAWAFYHIENEHAGLHGWQWLTVAIALFSFLAGVVILLFMPDSPTRTRLFSEDDKVLLVERVRSNDQGLKQKHFKMNQVIEAAKDPFTYLLFLLAVSQTMVVGGLGNFSILLINKAFGFDVLTSQLLSIPLGMMVVVSYMLIAWAVTKTRQTLLCMILFTIPNIAGTITLITVAPTASTRGGLIVAFYFMQFFQANNPTIFLMLSRNSAGQTKKSVTYAVTYMGWAGGNAIAPQLFQAQWAPGYITSLEIHLGLCTSFLRFHIASPVEGTDALFIITCLVTRVLLQRRNAKKIAAQTQEDGTVVNTNSRAFEDLTDLENPDFRYSV